MTVKERPSAPLMLSWQYKNLLACLGQITLHASDDSCPCNQVHLGDDGKYNAEYCLGKHLIDFWNLCLETGLMDFPNRDMLDIMATEADEFLEKAKTIYCKGGTWPDLALWSRDARKKLEPVFYSCAAKKKASLRDAVADMAALMNPKAELQDHPERFKLVRTGSPLHNGVEEWARVRGKVGDIAKLFDLAAPKVRITGTCDQKVCSLKVTGTIKEVQATTAGGLPDAIDSVIRHLEKRAEGKATPLTYAIGSTSLTRYELRYVVRPADSLVTSNNAITFETNPAYPQDMQPRLRGRASNKAQVIMMAANLDPDALLDDFHSIDRGAPIVDDSGVVLSGNGRVMAIQHAISEFPESYAVYKDHLTQAAGNYGLKIGRVENPVLVRQLVSKVEKRTFVEEANASTSISASAIEIARSDAQKITPSMLNSLEIGDGQGIEDALRSTTNSAFVSSFLSKLSANERAGVADAKGGLNQDGIRRITMAIFVSVFPGDVGIRIAEKFFESTDVNARNVFNGIVGALGRLAQSESLIRDGQRAKALSIGDDLARSVVAYSDIKKTPGMTVDKYLAQSQMFERTLNKFQETLLVEIDRRSRSSKKIAGLLKAYADIVIASPPPSQGSLIPGAALSKEDALSAAIARSEQSESAPMFDVKGIAALFAPKGSGKSGVCNFLSSALTEESKAGDEYRGVAFAAKHEGMAETSRTLYGIARTEDGHFRKIKKLIANSCEA